MFPLRRLMAALGAALWIGLLLPVQLLLLRLGSPLARALPRLFHKGVCRLLRIQVETRGTPLAEGPVLFASNHVSWMDIPVLGSILKASFIAKHEVSGWPLFGLLARCQRTVFIERRARKTIDHRDEMVVRLEQRDCLILFAEGTSGDGLRVLPYKSAFFSLAEKRIGDRPLAVQPVSIAFTRLNNLPVGRRATQYYSWVGDEDLLPHLWRYMGAGPGRVVVEFHPPVTIEQFASRKELANYCRNVTRQGVDDAKTGRPARRGPLPLPGPQAEPAAGAGTAG